MPQGIHPKNLAEVLELYYAELRASRDTVQAQRIQQETDSAIYRFVLPPLGLPRTPDSRRQTQAELGAAQAFLHTVALTSLPKLEALAATAFEQQQVSQAVRNTYGGRIRQLHAACATQPWYPGYRTHNPNFRAECALPLPRTFGRTSGTLLMPEKVGVCTSSAYDYSLKPEAISPQLQAELAEFHRFISDKYYPGRVIAAIQPDLADAHVAECLRWLGWWHRDYAPTLPLAELSLTLLIPLVTEDELDGLSTKAQKRLWREVRTHVNTWLMNYFEFLDIGLKSRSPRTREQKLAKVMKLFHFNYRHEVELLEDYATIPLIGAIKALQRQSRQQAQEWTQAQRYVADQSQKWPEVPADQTALAVLREDLFVKLLWRCRPRNASGVLHNPRPLAQFHACALMWAELLLEPPRRQQEFRSRRIGLTCPLQRPASVPPDGYYHPLPPDELRTRDRDGAIADNYLYRTYERHGVVYPEGIWVKQICQYKTRKYHGAQDIIIRNRPLGDGLMLYDLLERYLYGYWYPGNFRDSVTYAWWESTRHGQRGRWLMQGVLEFGADCHPLTDPRAGDWGWTLLFPCPSSGKMHTTDSLANAFAISSHQWIGKRITPHTLRYIWATWAFQVKLEGPQLRSLAYAMGTSAATLEKWYERCTPDDKRQPIEEVVDEYFWDWLEQVQAEGPPLSHKLRRVLSLAQALSPAEQQQLLRSLQSVS